MTLSIIIVSYNVREFLEQALVSIKKAVENISCEIFVVDNASSDGSPDIIARKFPDVRLIKNNENLGFAKANNQAIRTSRGRYVCIINPDTIVQENTFSRVIEFFENNAKVGAVGCKILNPDGTLQLACRRSYPTPWVAFTKIVGLARLFPKSKIFGRYNLTFLDPEKTAKVEALSGSFMVVRRETIDQVGMLDESFFMYGEDLDWCFRIRKGGWEIYYLPTTQIVHFKGESSKKSPFEQRRLFYEAMHLFVKKHFGTGKALMPSWLLIVAVWIRAVVSFASTAIGKLLMPLFDLLIMSASLGIAIYLRFRPDFPLEPFAVVYIVYSAVWLVSLTARGAYGRQKLSGTKATSAVLLGWLINSALTFFFKQYGFSRAVVLTAGIINLIFIPGWRVLLKALARSKIEFFRKQLRNVILNRRSVIVGDKNSSEQILARLKNQVEPTYQIHGVILSDHSFDEDRIAGVPVLGYLDHLQDIVKREKVQEVIFATDKIAYNIMLTAIGTSNGAHVNFKLVPSNLDVIIGKATTDYIEDIPLVDLDYKLHSFFNKSVKRSMDVLFAALLMIVTAPVMAWLSWIKKIPQQKIIYKSGNSHDICIQEFQFPADSHRLWRRLPALPSILQGEMSFVGRELITTHEKSVNTHLSLQPGLTGLEQLNRHSDLSPEEREKYHLYYLKNYTPLLDMVIIFKELFRKHKSA
ncbi:MAG: glycosyltransferase [Calditrichaeota bacterium]|nr:glycosyltransferase [Calditrichota bacterium]